MVRADKQDGQYKTTQDHTIPYGTIRIWDDRTRDGTGRTKVGEAGRELVR